MWKNTSTETGRGNKRRMAKQAKEKIKLNRDQSISIWRQNKKTRQRMKDKQKKVPRKGTLQINMDRSSRKG